MKRFTKLVNETVNSGFSRGINLFMENLQVEIQKNLFLENNGIAEVVSRLFTEDVDQKDDLIDIDWLFINLLIKIKREMCMENQYVIYYIFGMFIIIIGLLIKNL